jgi:hypothetical protein
LAILKKGSVMRLFLDTEFNGFGGELTSLALAAEDGRDWHMCVLDGDKVAQ